MRNEYLKVLIEHYKLKILIRTLQKHLKRRRKAEFFKKQRTKKLKNVDKAERVNYEIQYKFHIINNF